MCDVDLRDLSNYDATFYSQSKFVYVNQQVNIFALRKR